MEAKPNCLVPDCETPQYARGLCRSHYCKALREIKRGSADEADLIGRGLLRERQNRGRCRDSIFDKGHPTKGRDHKPKRKGGREQ